MNVRRLLFGLPLLVAFVLAGLSMTRASFTAQTSVSFDVGAGTVGIQRSGDGLVFSSAPLAPGDVSRATITVTNSGSAPSELALAREQLSSTQPGGCAVRDALRLTVVEAGKVLTDGPLKDAPAALPLGRFAGGEAHTYVIGLRFAPQHGATATDNDNCFQGSVATERFAWQAAEATA